MKRDKRGGAVVPVRLPPDVLQALDALMERMRAERPGLRVTRSDAVRVLLLRALEGERSRGD